VDDFFVAFGGVLIFALVIMVLACPLCAAAVGASKGRSWINWFLVGAFFGPIGLIAAVGIAPIDLNDNRARLGLRSNKRVCPLCAETVLREAVICRYCKTDLEPLE
jgi:hypothetical protein